MWGGDRSPGAVRGRAGRALRLPPGPGGLRRAGVGGGSRCRGEGSGGSAPPAQRHRPEVTGRETGGPGGEEEAHGGRKYPPLSSSGQWQQ